MAERLRPAKKIRDRLTGRGFGDLMGDEFCGLKLAFPRPDVHPEAGAEPKFGARQTGLIALFAPIARPKIEKTVVKKREIHVKIAQQNIRADALPDEIAKLVRDDPIVQLDIVPKILPHRVIAVFDEKNL